MCVYVRIYRIVILCIFLVCALVPHSIYYLFIYLFIVLCCFTLIINRRIAHPLKYLFSFTACKYSLKYSSVLLLCSILRFTHIV